MPWIRFEDTFPDHPKVLKVGWEAAWFHVRGIAYCSRHLTDGVVTRAAAKELAPSSWARLAGRLIRAGLWEATPGGYLIHDYLEYQPSKQHVLDQRQKRAEAGRIGGSSKVLGFRSSKGEANAKQSA